VVAQLYARRARAFGTASGTSPVTALDRVYTADSPQRAADEEQIQALAAATERLRGFAPSVVRVSDVRTSGQRVELRLVDRWPGYDVVPAGRPDGPALRAGVGRPEAAVRMVLASTPAGWRIDQVERLP
jgi:hypothetical protein